MLCTRAARIYLSFLPPCPLLACCPPPPVAACMLNFMPLDNSRADLWPQKVPLFAPLNKELRAPRKAPSSSPHTSGLAGAPPTARRLRPESAMRRDGERDEAHAGGEHAVLRVNAMGGNGRVSSKAAGVGVLRVDVGGAGDVEGL